MYWKTWGLKNTVRQRFGKTGANQMMESKSGCFVFHGNQIADVEPLREYLDTIYPQDVKDIYDLSKDNVYITFHLKYLFDEPTSYNMDVLSWYGNGNRTVETIYDSKPVTVYKVKEEVRRNVTDLIAVVDDHPEAIVVKEFISRMEKHMGRRVLKVVFTMCGEAHRLKMHKDFSVKYDNKLHLVIENGGISSLIWYDDDMKEIDRADGQPGDLFYFDGQKYLHRFANPKSNRIHLIMCFE